MADQHSIHAEEDLDSDEDDNDYMPSEEESEEEVVSGLEDDVLDSSETPKKGKKRKGRNEKASFRKRRGGFQLEDDNKNNDQPNESNDMKTECSQDEESQKKRADSLWADFLSDVPPPAKQNATAKLSMPALNEIKKVKLTKVYQFAGEEVKVVKEVDANSKELFLETSISKTEPKKENCTEAAKTPPAGGVVPRQSGLSNVLGKISGNKNKLSTLEKSKLDWETFKSDNRISEDLEQHNRGKDGFLEKQAFLERADLRQFENEKTLRIKGRNTKNW